MLFFPPSFSTSTVTTLFPRMPSREDNLAAIRSYFATCAVNPSSDTVTSFDKNTSVSSSTLTPTLTPTSSSSAHNGSHVTIDQRPRIVLNRRGTQRLLYCGSTVYPKYEGTPLSDLPAVWMKVGFEFLAGTSVVKVNKIFGLDADDVQFLCTRNIRETIIVSVPLDEATLPRVWQTRLTIRRIYQSWRAMLCGAI